MLKRFSVDSFRYFLVREAPYGNDVTFSEEAVATRQKREKGDLWRFSTRSVEGRGGRLKHIGRRMICWRRRFSPASC